MPLFRCDRHHDTAKSPHQLQTIDALGSFQLKTWLRRSWVYRVDWTHVGLLDGIEPGFGKADAWFSEYLMVWNESSLIGPSSNGLLIPTLFERTRYSFFCPESLHLCALLHDLLECCEIR